jgi:hypothetical protein
MVLWGIASMSQMGSWRSCWVYFNLTHTPSKIFQRLRISAIHIATLHSSRHERAIGIFNDEIDLALDGWVVIFNALLKPANRFVVRVAFKRIGLNLPVSDYKVRPDNDSDVVNL